MIPLDQKNDSLQNIPGIGPNIENDLKTIGINCVKDLKNKDPEQLYEKLQIKAKTNIDRCVLYVFRCAVHFVNSNRHDPERLKWWNWKDKK